MYCTVADILNMVPEWNREIQSGRISSTQIDSIIANAQLKLQHDLQSVFDMTKIDPLAPPASVKLVCTVRAAWDLAKTFSLENIEGRLARLEADLKYWNTRILNGSLLDDAGKVLSGRMVATITDQGAGPQVNHFYDFGDRLGQPSYGRAVSR